MENIDVQALNEERTQVLAEIAEKKEQISITRQHAQAEIDQLEEAVLVLKRRDRQAKAILKAAGLQAKAAKLIADAEGLGQVVAGVASEELGIDAGSEKAELPHDGHGQQEPHASY